MDDSATLNRIEQDRDRQEAYREDDEPGDDIEEFRAALAAKTRDWLYVCERNDRLELELANERARNDRTLSEILEEVNRMRYVIRKLAREAELLEIAKRSGQEEDQ